MKLILALAVAATLNGCISVQDKNGGSRFVRSQSPTHMGTAIFTKEIGLQDTALSFEVRDPKIGDQPINIGLVGDEGFQGFPPEDAVWSKDGSVIAVRAAGSKKWTHAYDFKTHRNFEEIYLESKRPSSIENLLKNRGGAGPKVLPDWEKFDQVARPVASRDSSR